MSAVEKVIDTRDREGNGEGYVLIPDDEIVVAEVVGRDGPFPGQPRDGKPGNDWYRINWKVRGGDWDGFDLTYITDKRVTTQNKSGKLFEALLNCSLEDIDEVDWDDLTGRKARLLIGHRVSNQGGTFNTIKQIIKITPRKPQPTSEFDELADEADRRASK